MPKEASNNQLTLALNTMLEREFVSPLTSIRGTLEIMRDFADLSDEERSRFLKNALQDCARLEQGVEQLAEPRRWVVLLYLYGYSLKDSAGILGWNSKRVDNQRYQGLAALRRYLAEQGYEP